jgi:hypothetical protein
VPSDKYVKFTSRLGSFVAPSSFVVNDDHDDDDDEGPMILHSPDGQATIKAYRFKAADWEFWMFRGTMVVGVCRNSTDWTHADWEPADWRPAEWVDVDIGGQKARGSDFVPTADVPTRWRLYVFEAQTFYYAIVLRASTTAMALNGAFYESIVRSFGVVRE